MNTPPIPIDDAERAEDLRRLDILLTTPEESLDRLTQELARIFDVPGAFISFIDEDTQYYKSIVGQLPEPYGETRMEPREMSVCSYVVGMNDELVVEDMSADARFCDNPAVVDFGVRFYAGAPLRADSGRAVGSLCIVDMKPRTISERERELLNLIAQGIMATVKLQVASRNLLNRRLQMENDLHQAVEVQRFLLPPALVEGDDWRIEHLYQPVDHLGGDFIDIVERPDGRWAIILGDVSGHGTSAALTTMMTKTAFRRSARWVGAPAQLLDAMHRELHEAIPPGQFITAFAAIFAPASRQVTFAAAGHPHPIFIGAGGADARLLTHQNGLPLCVDETATYHGESAVTLAPGERFMIYTDGAFEVRNAAGDMLTPEALLELASEVARRPAASDDPPFLTRVFTSLREKIEGRFEDDVALLCIEAT